MIPADLLQVGIPAYVAQAEGLCVLCVCLLLFLLLLLLLCFKNKDVKGDKLSRESGRRVGGDICWIN